MLPSRSRADVQDIVESGLCMGCGACEAVAGSERLQVRWDERGACRPHILVPLDAAAQARIRAVCPGLRMELGGGGALPARHRRRQPRPVAAVDDVVFGHVEQMVEAYAADPEVRFAGSSGGRAHGARRPPAGERPRRPPSSHVAASATHPLRTEAHVEPTRDDVLRPPAPATGRRPR